MSSLNQVGASAEARLFPCSRQVDQLDRWRQDAFRFPPYQYQTRLCARNKAGNVRLPSVEEREVLMGFCRGYTSNCLPKS